MIKLDRGFVPMPRKKSGVDAYKYPFAKMKINSSFFAPLSSKKKAGNIDDLRSAIGTCIRRFIERNQPSWRFATRTMAEKGRLGVRVWRIL